MSMKDSCGLCSGLLVTEPEVSVESPKHSNSLLAQLDDGVVEKPSKLDSIVEEKKDDDAVVSPAPSSTQEPIFPIKEERKLAVAVAACSPRASARVASPVNEIFVVKDVKERDFDKNPTDLYLSLMRKDWGAAIARCTDHPDESETWIYRRETTGKLRWKLLPIHSSIIFGAPVAVIQALLNSNSKTATYKDDQGMVPLHLAIRMGSDEAVIEALVTAQPGSVSAKDRKGRTPRHLAEKHHSKAAVIQTLDRGLSQSTDKAVAVSAGAAPISAHIAVPPAPQVVTVDEIVEPTAPPTPKAEPRATPILAMAKAVVQAVMSPNVVETPVLSAKTQEKAPDAPSPRVSHAVLDSVRQAHRQEMDKIKDEHKEALALLQKDHSSVSDSLKAASEAKLQSIAGEAELKHAAAAGRIELLEQTLAMDKANTEALQAELTSCKEREVDVKSKVAELEFVVSETKKEKETMETATKSVNAKLVDQVAELQAKLHAEVVAKETLLTEKVEFEKSSSIEVSKLKLKISEIELECSQAKSLHEETAAKLHIVQDMCASQNTELVELKDKTTMTTKHLHETKGKLDEITISEQALAWENNTLTEKLANVPPSAKALATIAALEGEREELRDTVNKLSVKLYKVVGFLDEMVQEQEAIITETLTRDSEQPGPVEVDVETSEDRKKLLDNVNGMKEQIAGVIDSVIDSMPKTDVDDEEETAGETRAE